MSNDKIMERHKIQVRFKNADMDFLFQWALGYGLYGGLSHGELFAIAAGIKDGHPDSWVKQFRAAAYEKRIRALIADVITFDIGTLLDAELPALFRRTGLSNALIRVASSIDKVVQVGVRTPQEFLELARRGQVDVSRIDCPVLCLAGEGDPPAALRQHRAAFEQLRSSHKVQRIFTVEEGADAHCQLNNLPLLHQVIFDWLDDVLK